ncbi:MAG: TonB-dependent copper receptor [Gammaproteobacteria bacterium]|nr:TonB-dependent copper receptor [Gammaproteobacteria bacterium]
MQAPAGKCMRKITFYRQPLTVAVMLALASQAGAQERDTTYLPTAVVTGVAQSAPGTVVTDPKLPRQPVPASDGADYLKTIPGFSALRSGGVNSDPVFRGMFGSRLKLLTNGGEMLGACPSRMDSPSSYIAPETYDKLTVIKGPQSVQWGPGNSAATVLFERGPEQFEDFDTRIDANVLVGSNRRFDRNLDAALGNKQGYLRLSGNQTKAHDYNDGDGKRVPSRWNKWNSDVALGWTPGENTLLELTAGAGDGESRYAGRGMDGTRFKRESLGLRFKQENLTDTWQALEAQVYYNYADHVMDNYKLRDPDANAAMAMMRNPFVSQVDRRTLGARVKGSWQWGDIGLVAGVDAQRNEHRARKGAAATYKNQNLKKDAEFGQWGLFAETTWQMAERDRLVSGLRVDRHRARDKRSQLCNMMGMGCFNNPSYNNTTSKTLPSGFIRHEHDLASLPATSYVGLGHSQRFPDYWEMFTGANHMRNGGPSAFYSTSPEKTTQLDFGIQYAQGPVELWASGYVGYIRDYILFSYMPGMNPLHTMTYIDNVNARIMGAELGGSHRFAPGWKADASLAYAWGKNSSDGKPLPQMPPLEARLGLSYEQGNWSTGGLWRVVAAQNRVDDRDRGRGNVAGKDFGKSSGFGVFSANAAYRFNANWKVSAGIDNLFDKTYSEHLNLAGSGGFGYPADTRINETGRIWWTRLDMSF